MWNAVYERHAWSEKYATSRFQSANFWKAWVVYQFWSFGYALSVLPVKRISLYWSDGEVIRTHVSWTRSRNPDQLAKLKRRN